MCHWVLRIWKCGESGFTKYLSCSFDLAAHDPGNLLNTLHPSITPSGASDKPSDTSNGVKRARDARNGARPKTSSQDKQKDKLNPMHANIPGQSGSAYPAVPTTDETRPFETPALVSASGRRKNLAFAQDVTTGETIPILLSEIGKASRFGDKTLERGKCTVFEVVLQSREQTACPACQRSPQRAKLPPHACGYFGLR